MVLVHLSLLALVALGTHSAPVGDTEIALALPVVDSNSVNTAAVTQPASDPDLRDNPLSPASTVVNTPTNSKTEMNNQPLTSKLTLSVLGTKQHIETEFAKWTTGDVKANVKAAEEDIK